MAVVAVLMAAPAFGATVWLDEASWLDAVGGEADGRIDWDTPAMDEGQHTVIAGDHYSSLFAGPTLSVDAGSGLYVGNPDPTVDNDSGFFGSDFVAVSGNNVFSPDLAGSPEGILTITFEQPIHAIGAWFLDVEQDYLYTGIEINGVRYHFNGSQGDDAQSFLGVTGVGAFTEARIHMSSKAGQNGVGIDDVVYAVAPAPAAVWAGFVLMGAVGGVAGSKRKLRRQ
jgi:hypothetical protein